MGAYLALIRKDEDSDFGVDFPDFPGCITAGRTLDEARSMAQEALTMHVRGLVEDGDAIPVPSNLDAVVAYKENSDAVAFFVEVDTRPSVRIEVTLPEDLLERIDEVAPNRSAFLAEAAREKLRAV